MPLWEHFAGAWGSHTRAASEAVRSVREGELHFRWVALFDVHVLEFAGLENFATLEALDELGVLIARHDLDARVAARLFHRFVGRRSGKAHHANRSHTEA